MPHLASGVPCLQPASGALAIAAILGLFAFKHVLIFPSEEGSAHANIDVSPREKLIPRTLTVGIKGGVKT